ncbi:hypothetical protein [uncultured Spirosoma sp.]|uniref:hypothetical protein n=1 Tax=uncultured Spirosoma sp. TaxID=278208 RepID=UPI00258CEBD7|nr:hypothetical protein [uncultured Spirosoma sp.]
MKTHMQYTSAGSQAATGRLIHPLTGPNQKRTMPAWLWRSLLAICLLQAQLGLAQVGESAGNQLQRVPVDRGYWRLNTLASTQTTQVQFFSPAHQLLYEERMSGRWVNLTRKNQKQFDQLLDQLVSNQLLATRIKTTQLPESADELIPADLVPVATAQSIRATTNSRGELFLAIDNPAYAAINVSVMDRDQALYEESASKGQYRRKLDVSAVDGDACRLLVRLNNQLVVYRISRPATPSAYRLLTPVGQTGSANL